jgi:D-glycero-alpha-D-manno-heptose 1-phosphate guanylyltransferase
MSPRDDTAEMLDAIILCGGRGTRLASVISNVPKPLAPVLEQPFLDHLLALLVRSKVARSATLAIHHLADQIIAYYAGHAAPLPLRFVTEDRPLGTGGAMMNCLAAVEGPTFLCLNGDSVCGGDLAALLAAHRRAGPGITLGLVQVPDTSRYGRAMTDQDGRILAFHEKAASLGAGLINAGIYVIDRAVLEPWDGEPLSLERDVLPGLVARECVRGHTLSGPFIDIGLPETYAAVPDFISRLRDGPGQNSLGHRDLTSV